MDPYLEELRMEYAAAELHAEGVAAGWLTARAGGDFRAWRDTSTKLDVAMAELNRTKHRFEKAEHKAVKAAKLKGPPCPSS